MQNYTRFNEDADKFIELHDLPAELIGRTSTLLTITKYHNFILSTYLKFSLKKKFFKLCSIETRNSYCI